MDKILIPVSDVKLPTQHTDPLCLLSLCPPHPLQYRCQGQQPAEAERPLNPCQAAVGTTESLVKDQCSSTACWVLPRRLSSRKPWLTEGFLKKSWARGSGEGEG